MDSTIEQALGLRLYAIFIPTLSISGIILNSVVVYSSGLLIEMRQHPSNCYMFLGNLGLSNLCMSVTVLFGHYYPSRNEFSCALQLGMIVSTSLQSVYSVLLVAIDRFLYILRGIHYQKYMFPRRVRVLTTVSWSISISVGLLISLIPSFWGRISSEQCWFILLTPGLVLATTLLGTIPILIIFILYGIILHRALSKIDELNKLSLEIDTENNLRFFRGRNTDICQESEGNLKLNRLSKLTNLFCCWEKKSSRTIEEIRRKPPSKWKAIKVVIFSTISYLLTWVPYFIVSTMYVYCDQQNNSEYCYQLKLIIVGPLAIISFSNSLLNPLIYCWWHNGFRTNSIRLLSRRFEQYSCCQIFLKKKVRDASSERTTQLSNLTNTSIITSNTHEIGASNQ